MCAVASGQCDIVTELISLGANVNIQNHSKNTPCTRSYADARAYGKHGIIADWNGIAL